jgi:hypothetical protein
MQLLRRVLTSVPLVGLSAVLLLSPALLDLPLSGTRYVSAHLPNTVEAVIAVLSVFVIAQVVERRNREREDAEARRRFDRLATVTYRSLSHRVNDAERMLLAPVTGLSLWDAGIPGGTPADADHDRERRRAAGLAAQLPQPETGFWMAHLDAMRIRRELALLAADPAFAERMFRTAATVRRMFQQSIGDIAAVALTVPDLSSDVDHVGRLADDLVELQEAWRTAARTGTPESLALAQDTLLDTVTALDSTLMGMQPRARLPAGLPPVV